jgi:hypothetical protein
MAQGEERRMEISTSIGSDRSSNISWRRARGTYDVFPTEQVTYIFPAHRQSTDKSSDRSWRREHVMDDTSHTVHGTYRLFCTSNRAQIGDPYRQRGLG